MKRIICKKVGYIMVVMIMLLIFAVVAFSKIYVEKSVKMIEFDYGEEFKGFEFFDYQGNSQYTLKNRDYCVVFYLSSSCKSCIEALKNFNLYKNLFGDTFEFLILWQDKIPSNLVDKYDIEMQNNYSLKGKYKLSISTPSFFVLEKNKVVFVDSSFQNFSDKLISSNYIKDTELQNKATEYIRKNFFENESTDKNKLLYFYMDGCVDCEEMEQLLKQNDMYQLYDVQKLYTQETQDSSKKVDKYNVFSSIYKIEWYPSFLLIQDDGIEIISNENSNDLINLLKDTVK